MTEITDLPPRERAIRYRELAADAERYASQNYKDDSVKSAYNLMAKQWLRLAEEIEAELDREKD